MTGLELVALGFAAAEADHAVREAGGPNTGPRIRKYLANVDPPINVAAPWCAAFVQYCADRAAALAGAPNPLDAVKLEAYVQSYHEWAKKAGAIVPPEKAEPGDLVLYDFHGTRWDHIGILVVRPDADSWFRAIEGNTNEAGSRDGDGVFFKLRRLNNGYPVEFVRWAA